VKILWQVKDAALEPLADDIATLALDMKVAETGYVRRGVNPFLIGYGGGRPAEADPATPEQPEPEQA
jgi:formate dehydrogenase maturation protein FdhE